jgi:16S rRNA (adenine1518-N6/adenine1519-N6)-dimethyltransferase
MKSPKDLEPRLPIPRSIRARHEHGQNFLTRGSVLAREIDYAGVGPEDRVLEIGPGIGHLTAMLAAKAGHVTAIELDEQFRPILEEIGQRYGNIELLWGDATTLPFPPFTKVVANLPYSVSLPLIFKLLEHEFTAGVLVIQERLARRLAAKPGQPGYSRISVLVQRTATLQVMEVVKARDFQPPPEVDSAMLRLRRHRPRYTVADMDYFRRFLDHAFLRRTLPLRQALPDVPAALLAGAGPKPVEGTSPEDLAKLANALQAADVVFPEVPDDIKRKSQKLTRSAT